MDWAELVSHWWLETTWKGGLLLLWGLVWLGFRPKLSADRRHLTLRWAVLTAAVLPISILVSPRWAVELSPRLSFLAAGPPQSDWATVGLGVWLAGAAYLLGMQLAGHLSVRRRIRTARVVNSGPAWLLHRSVLRSAGLSAAIPLLVSRQVTSPVATGTLRPALMVPPDCLDWPEEKLRLVFKHEAAHLRRRDNLSLALAHLACAFHWFNPLSWLALRRLRVEMEMACDDWVLGDGEKPSDYASMLLFAADRLKLPSTVDSPLLRRFTLTRRLLAVLDPDALRRPASRRQRAFAGATWAATLLAMAALTPVSFHSLWQERGVAPPQTRRLQTLAGLDSPLEIQSARQVGFPPTAAQALARAAAWRRGRDLPIEGAFRPLTPESDLNSPISPAHWLVPWRPEPGPQRRSFAARFLGGVPGSSSGNGDPPPDPAPDDQTAESDPVVTFEAIELSVDGFGDAAAYDINGQGVVAGAIGFSSTVQPAIWSPQKGAQLLGIPSGFLSASGLRINDPGQVLVQALKIGPLRQASQQLFLWSPHQGYQPVGDLEGCEKVSAADLNQEGAVLGVCELQRGSRSFVSLEGRVIDLGGLDGPLARTPLASTIARDLNGRGQVVGTSNRQAFLWTADGGMRPLFDALELSRLGLDPLAAPASDAFAVSEAGHVVGQVHLPWGVRAFLWTSEAGVRILEPDSDSAPQISSGAFAVSDRGTVFGTSLGFERPAILTWRQSFRWSPEEGLSPLAQVEATEDWSGLLKNRRVNSRDDLVGENWSQAGFGPAGGRVFAFVSVAGRGMVDLAEPVRDLEFSRATAVSQSGDVVGYGRGYDWEAQRATTPFRAFLWRRVSRRERP